MVNPAGPTFRFSGPSVSIDSRTASQQSLKRTTLPNLDLTNVPPPVSGSMGFNLFDENMYYSDGENWIQLLRSGGYLIESATDNIVAHNPGGQALATPLTTNLNRVTVVAAANDSVLLPNAVPGSIISVKNTGANVANIYPQGTGQIDSLGSSNPYFIQQQAMQTFFSFAANQFTSFGGIRIWILSEVQPSGTNGGTFVANTWVTRILNTIQGVGPEITLAANQFTITPGLYFIIANAPAYHCGRHKVRLFNVTRNATQEVGTSEYTAVLVDNAQTRGWVWTIIPLSTSQTFRIEHQCNTQQVGNGLYVADNFPGTNEVGTVCTIIKLS